MRLVEATRLGKRTMIQLVRRIVSLLDLSNTQEILLLGSFPPGAEGFASCLSKLGDFHQIDELASIRECLRDDRPTILISFVGLGTASGFLMNRTSGGQNQTLPESWWKPHGEQRAHVFSFACYSFDYFNSSDVMSQLSGAVGYEGEIWLQLTEDHFWVELIRRIIGLLREEERIGSSFYAKVQALYSSSILNNKSGPEGSISYLSHIALVQQSQSLKVIPGGYDL